MQRVLVINGPNLNMLGVRDAGIYGSTTLPELEDRIEAAGSDLGLDITTFQSNHEGEIIDQIHDARNRFDGMVLNGGALTHYSYAIHDAIEAAGIDTVEVHISNIRAREEWRRHSVTAPACVYSIYGRGIRGYEDALRHLVARNAQPFTTIAYGEGPDRVGDLRIPEGDGPFPVCVLLHGGFWRDAWTRDLMDAVAVDLTDRGWVTWNLEYHRVGSGGGWPLTLEDAAAGIDALLDLSTTTPIDLSRVLLLGHSAGGHLALWGAGRSRLASDAPGSRPVIHPAAVAALAPVADLEAAHRLGLGEGAVEDFLRRDPEAGPDRFSVASPTALLPLGVPQLVVHGDADEEVPVDLSRAYAGGAADSGDRIVYHEMEDVGHYELVDPRTSAWERIAAEVSDLV